MRLWTLHPRYLDARGLVALWREALLARAVLRGRTRGYRHHPQLARFRAHPAPLGAISAYLATVHAEATSRGYAFDARKIGPLRRVRRMTTTTGQVSHEWKHLMRKLSVRDRERHLRLRAIRRPRRGRLPASPQAAVSTRSAPAIGAAPPSPGAGRTNGSARSGARGSTRSRAGASTRT